MRVSHCNDVLWFIKHINFKTLDCNGLFYIQNSFESRSQLIQINIYLWNIYMHIFDGSSKYISQLLSWFKIILINRIFSSVVHSRNSSIPSNGSIQTRTNTDDDVSGQCSGASSRRPSRVNSRKSSYRPRKSSKNGGDVASPEESPVIKVFRVAMLGASEVGKSALTSQFLSSDHMNTYDTVGK